MYDPPCLRVHYFEAVAPVIVAEIQEEAWARLTVHFSLPRDAMIRRLAEWQKWHRRAAPEKYLVGGEHAAVRRGCGAVEAFRGPQDRLHPQTCTIRVSNSLELVQMYVREELVHPATCRPRLPLPRRNHRSTLLSGVIPGRGSSAASCRPTRSAPHSNQSVTLLMRSGCLLGNPMSLVGSVKRSRDSSRADSNSVKE